MDKVSDGNTYLFILLLVLITVLLIHEKPPWIHSLLMVSVYTLLSAVWSGGRGFERRSSSLSITLPEKEQQELKHLRSQSNMACSIAMGAIAIAFAAGVSVASRH